MIYYRLKNLNIKLGNKTFVLLYTFKTMENYMELCNIFKDISYLRKKIIDRYKMYQVSIKIKQ